MPDPLQTVQRPRGQLSTDDVRELCSRSSLIEATRSGLPKILRCAGADGEGLMLKLWHLSSDISSARLNPYSTRFRVNSGRLRERGVSAPDVCGWGKVHDSRMHYVCYRELPGQSLRDWIPKENLSAAARFIAGLHEAGIDFRSLHMGNILWDGKERFSLVDVTDCGFQQRPLGLQRRTRRILYFCFHQKEREYLGAERRWLDFVTAYCEAAHLSPDKMMHIAQRPLLRRRLPPGIRQTAADRLTQR